MTTNQCACCVEHSSLIEMCPDPCKNEDGNIQQIAINLLNHCKIRLRACSTVQHILNVCFGNLLEQANMTLLLDVERLSWNPSCFRWLQSILWNKFYPPRFLAANLRQKACCQYCLTLLCDVHDCLTCMPRALVSIEATQCLGSTSPSSQLSPATTGFATATAAWSDSLLLLFVLSILPPSKKP